MNEFESVFLQLVAKGWKGATLGEVAKTLGVRGEVGEWYALRVLVGVAKFISMLGLTVRFNPFTGAWVVTYTGSGVAERMGLSRRLKATLAAVIRAQDARGGALLDEIQRLRGKSRRSVLEDLKELEEMGLIRKWGKDGFRVDEVLAPFLQEY